MNLERVTFGFFVTLALTLNAVFMMGDIDNPAHHNVWVLTVALVVSFIATGLKLGDRSQVGALLLATSLVADLLLVIARVVWIVVDDGAGPSPEMMVSVVALAGGALVANIISATIIVGDTLMSRR